MAVLGRMHREMATEGRRCVFGMQYAVSAHWPVEGSVGEVFFVVCGQHPVGVQNAVRRNDVSLKPSGNLVCHSPDLLLLTSH